MEALIDNDILIKAACYDLFEVLLEGVVSTPADAGILGSARYVARRAAQFQALRGSAEEARSRLDSFASRATVIEPTNDEQRLAADLEWAAQRAGVALDTGESQLCAVFLTRGLGQICTGDKRAVHALEALLASDDRLTALCGRVICLEQLVLNALVARDFTSLYTAICAEPEVDKTLAICFSCTNNTSNRDETTYCLQSYIRDLRSKAPNILP